MGDARSPLLDHPLKAPSVFKPTDLMDAVRRERRFDVKPVPPLPLAVEMQAASPFAFAHASGVNVGLVALVSNSPAHSQEQFDTGGHDYRLRVLTAIAKAARASLDHLWLSRERHVAP
jgi:hypothetical protein